MRFLLDTNILIPLEDTQIPLTAPLAEFVRLARENGDNLLYHAATIDDIYRDPNIIRRNQTLARLRTYTRLDDTNDCPWNSAETGPNDNADNRILFALHCDAAHALITEDRDIHQKARRLGLGHRVYYIQAAHTWLRQLYELTAVKLPNIQEVPLYSLKPLLADIFFDSLRHSYAEFNNWFERKARNGNKAWVSWEAPGKLGAVCIFDIQNDQVVSEDGLTLARASLKLCTFKVSAAVRGRKIGELFLKAAFRYATQNKLEHIFIHGDADEHRYLFDLLEDFGFSFAGTHPGSNNRDSVYLKQHPIEEPAQREDTFSYFRKYFPHFCRGATIEKFIVPIRPGYHEILFPDYEHPIGHQRLLFESPIPAGNAIKLAYLCQAPTAIIPPGSIVLFYRSRDQRVITSIGVVERYQSVSDPVEIAQLVSRRTVYSMKDIERIASTSTKVMLFRHIKHFKNPIDHAWIERNNLLDGNIQTIRAIDDDTFTRILEVGER